MTNDDLVIVKRQWIDACVDAHVKLGIEPRGRKRVGFDVADDGPDRNAACVFKGFLCTHDEEWKGQEDRLLESCTRTWNLARAENADITYDSIGVGASAGSKFKELNASNRYRIRYTKFNANGEIFRKDAFYRPKIRNKDQFYNRKAQAWTYVADRARDTCAMVEGRAEPDEEKLLSISSRIYNIEGLLAELSTPFRDFSSTNGRTMVESKKELRKRKVASTNRADAFVMAATDWSKRKKFDFWVGTA